MTIPPTGDIGAAGVPGVDAQLFAVTAPPELTLAADRTGTTSFTITNLTGRPVRARLLPRGQAGALDSWLTVLGPAEVPMGVAATLTATVQVHVPPDVPAGSHTLFLEVVAEDDTESVAGQSVSFTVPPPVVIKRKFPWWLVIVAAVVLALIIGLVIFFVTRDDPTPPRRPGPVNSVKPRISGATRVGGLVVVDDGTWTGGTISFTRQWQRCDDAGKLCLDVRGAVGPNLALTIDDQNTKLRVDVTATDADGANTELSDLFGPIGAPTPLPTTEPPAPVPLVLVPDFTGDLMVTVARRATALGLSPIVLRAGFTCDLPTVFTQSLAVGAQVVRGTSITLTGPSPTPPSFCDNK